MDGSMGISQALCYPWVNIPEGKAANLILYWDSLATIVPAEAHGSELYSKASRVLMDKGWLRPIQVEPSGPSVREASKRLESLLFTERDRGPWPNLDMITKPTENTPQAPLDWRVNGAYLVHESKLGAEIQFWLGEREMDWPPGSLGHTGGRYGDKLQWRPMPKNLATLYLSAVCAIEARDRKLPLVASQANLSPWVEAIATGTQLARTIEIDKRKIVPEVDYPTLIECGYPECVLAEFTIQAVTLGANVSFDQAIKFREKNWDLLARYRREVEHTVAEVLHYPSDKVQIEARLRHCIETKILPAVQELKRARAASRLAAGTDIIKAVGFSVSPGLLEIATGHPFAGRIIAATGVVASVAITGASRFANRRIEDRSSPLSYLIIGRRALATPRERIR